MTGRLAVIATLATLATGSVGLTAAGAGDPAGTWGVSPAPSAPDAVDASDATPASAAASWEAAFHGPGVDNSVGAMTVWDDGTGPALYAGGVFRTAGDELVNGIARWDGTTWSPLTGSSGTGVNGTVSALAVYDGDLVVAGAFTRAGDLEVNRIALWDGTDWSALRSDGGVGVEGSRGPGIGALAVLGGDLYVGGSFETAGGVPANHVARWDGTEWSTLPGESDVGIAHAGVPSAAMVTSLDVFDGRLVVGGAFTSAGGAPMANIAFWEDGTWTSLGDGVGGAVVTPVYSMTTYDGDLIAGGLFTEADGVTVNRIARWDGTSWSALPGGTVPGLDRTVDEVLVHDGYLVVGGQFGQAGGTTMNRIARWDGSTWSAMPGATDIGVGDSTSSVQALAAFDGDLFVGGHFETAGGLPANHLARWDDGWVPVAAASTGLNGTVHDGLVHEGALVVAGDFTQAGGVSAPRIARWDGSSWSALGDGLDQFSVYALAVFDGDLIAAGSFTSSGGTAVNRVARFDGTSWQPMGDGMNQTVRDLVVHDGTLVAGGQFTTADGQAVDHIAVWNGTSWQPLGGDAANGTSGAVRVLTVYDGVLVAGGSFTEAGGTTVNRIARWDGAQWSGFGGQFVSGVDGQVDAIVEYDGGLVAGGSFLTAGGVDAQRIARWDPSHGWSPLGAGMDNAVNAVAVYQGDLVAGGAFPHAGTGRVDRIARWDGTEWLPLSGPYASGADDGITFLLPVGQDGDAGPAALDGTLIAGGYFQVTGGVPNWHLGVYRPQTVTVGPESLDFGDVPVGTSSETLDISVANTGDEPVTITDVSALAATYTTHAGTCGDAPFTVAPGSGCSLGVSFHPTEEGPVRATVLLAGDARAAEYAVNLTGTGTPPPPAVAVDPDAIEATVAPGQDTTVPLTVANSGAGTLEWQVRPNALAEAGDVLRPDRGAETTAPAPGLTGALPLDHGGGNGFHPSPRPATLTHSASMAIAEENTVACLGGLGSTGPNHFLRTFTLSDFAIARAYHVEEVTFGVESLSTSAPVTVNLYTLSGPLQFENLTLIGSARQTLGRQTSTLVTVPVTGRVPAQGTLVVEIAPPDLSGRGAFFPASNTEGESAPSYVAAPGCDAPEPVSYAELGFDDVHLVMSVSGRLDDGRCDLPTWATVQPGSGTVAPGEQAGIDVTLSSDGVPAGEYTAHLCLDTNDPAAPLVMIPLTLTVEDG